MLCLPSERLHGLCARQAQSGHRRLRRIRSPETDAQWPGSFERHRRAPSEHELGFREAAARYRNREAADQGIVTREDAQLAVEHGVDGLMVSNHGGRAEETLRPTIESLPEVIEGVSGKIPVIVDGGLRRGTDVFKALAFGASAVGIGRPPAWGLAAFGQAGVQAVREILRRELRTIMRQAGTISVNKITRNYVAGRSS